MLIRAKMVYKLQFFACCRVSTVLPAKSDSDLMFFVYKVIMDP